MHTCMVRPSCLAAAPIASSQLRAFATLFCVAFMFKYVVISQS